MEAQKERVYKRREEVIEATQQRYQTQGGLSEKEIRELIDYEFYTMPSNMEQQARVYFLKLKSSQPANANRMQGELETVLKRGIKNEEDVKTLCFVLHAYLSGFTITYNGTQYTMLNNKFRLSSELKRKASTEVGTSNKRR